MEQSNPSPAQQNRIRHTQEIQEVLAGLIGKYLYDIPWRMPAEGPEVGVVTAGIEGVVLLSAGQLTETGIQLSPQETGGGPDGQPETRIVILAFTHQEWEAAITGIRHGELAPGPDGEMLGAPSDNVPGPHVPGLALSVDKQLNLILLPD